MSGAYSKAQFSQFVKETGLSVKSYIFPIGSGSFTGTLVAKEWNNKRALICFFDADDGQKYKICVWYNADINRTYRPSKDGPCMADVPQGTVMRVEYTQTSGGNTKWLTAEICSDEL